MVIRNIHGRTLIIPNNGIQSVSFPKAKELMPLLSDYTMGQVSRNELIMHIRFKDGSADSYRAHDWIIVEV